MVNFPGRDRRRRVLKDEVLAASSNNSYLRTDSDDVADDAPRYSDAAGVENHPQITDFVPRRYRSIATVIVAGGGITAVLGALQLFVEPVMESHHYQNAGALSLIGIGGFASWVSAVVLLMTSALCLMTYSLRRHRIDDFRGRYRVWRAATFACLMMSAVSVTGLHHIIATAMTQLTGWSALRDGAVWWLIVPGLPMTWIGLRALFDVRECRLAATLLTFAAATYFTSAVTYLGFVPVASVEIQSLIVGAALLMGHFFLLAGAIAYARFVILDAQSLIPRVQKPLKHSVRGEADKATSAARLGTTTKTDAAAATPKYAPVAAKSPAETNQWVDGSRPEREHYGDDDDEDGDGTRKLSKADRKRLRKLKTDGRAA